MLATDTDPMWGNFDNYFVMMVMKTMMVMMMMIVVDDVVIIIIITIIIWCFSFHKFSLQLSAFSLCSSCLISALLVLSTIYL